jgi:pimeloyl-ACP methyl ester carboxylesterase
LKLLFISGAGAGKEEWVYQTEYFNDSEAVALPGHPNGRPCTSIDDYVEWLHGYIHQRQYQDVVLVGHSMGSAIVQLYGLKYGKEVKALVLIGGGAKLRVLPAALAELEGMVTDVTAWRKYEEERYRLVAPEVRRLVLEAKMLIGPAVMLNDMLCCDRFDIMDRVHTIELPTLLICGSEDEMTPIKYTKYLAGNIEGAASVIIEGATHMVFLEKPREVNRAIDGFLVSLS